MPYIERGVAGGSAQREYERRLAGHERRLEQRWGTGGFGRLARFLSPAPASTVAWERGAEGERRLARGLDGALGERGFVLHDRRLPGARCNIDHIVIAPTGVWVIDAKRYTGTVERRDAGSFFRPDERLFVDGRDRTVLADGMGWQVEAVHSALGELARDDVPVRPVLCFVDAEWRWFAKPFRVAGVRVTWPRDVCDRVAADGPLEPRRVAELAQRLATELAVA